MIGSIKKSNIKSSTTSIAETNNHSLHKDKHKFNVDSQLTFKERLAIFKLRKKPRKQIILRFSTITNGLELPNLSIKENQQKNIAAKNKLKALFKIDQKDNLSNAKNYQQRGNKISIPVKKTILMDSNINCSYVQNKGFSTQKLRKTTHVLNFLNRTGYSRSNHSFSRFGNKNKSQLRQYNTSLLIQDLDSLPGSSFYRSKQKKLSIQTVTKFDLQRTKNQFFNAKRMNQLHRQKLEINKKILDMEGMVYQKSQQVIRNA